MATPAQGPVRLSAVRKISQFDRQFGTEEQFNTIGVRGLDLIAWQQGRDEARFLDSDEYTRRSKLLDQALKGAMAQAMKA